MMLLLAILLPVSGSSQGRPFLLEGLQGGGLGPGDFDQGVVIAVVWASWSPHCRNIVNQVNGIADRWGSQARVIMVDFQEEKPDVEAFLAGKRPKASVYLDKSGAFSKKYSVTNLPGMVIFRDGTAAFSGKLPRNPDSVISQTLG
jgi:thiol-disulfide isomerase/thioredoxin